MNESNIMTNLQRSVLLPTPLLCTQLCLCLHTATTQKWYNCWATGSRQCFTCDITAFICRSAPQVAHSYITLTLTSIWEQHKTSTAVENYPPPKSYRSWRLSSNPCSHICWGNCVNLCPLNMQTCVSQMVQLPVPDIRGLCDFFKYGCDARSMASL
jgi:hypothetical protein